MQATRTRRSRWAGPVALAFAAVLAFPSATFAATTPPAPSEEPCNDAATVQCTVSTIGFKPGGELVFTVKASQGGVQTDIDHDSIQVSGHVSNGKSVQLKIAPSASTGVVTRELMLLLDTSQSMDGAEPGQQTRFQSEIRAAKTFITLLGDNTPKLRVGVATFGSGVRIAQPPTDELTQVQAAIDKVSRLDRTPKTDLFKAVTVGAQQMQPDSARFLLMITDGHNDPPLTDKDTVSQAELNKSLGVKTANPITFQGVLVGNDPRRDIYKIGGDVAQLQNASTLGDDLNKFVTGVVKQQKQTLDVSATGAPGDWVNQDVTVLVTAKTANGDMFRQTATIAGPVNIPAATTAATASLVAPASSPTSIPYGVLIGAILAVFAALAILLTSATGALAGADNKKSAVIRRLELYTVSGGKPARVEVTEQTTRLGDSALTRSAVNLMTRFARRSRMDDALDGQLEAAGLPLRTAEWMLLHIGIAVLGALLLVVISGGQIAAGVVGLLLGIAGPWIFLTLARSRRESKFLAQLPDTLQLLAGSLAAGYSLPQAMDSVVRESHPPISVEFNRALVEARLGMLAEDALDGIAQRTGSTDFSWIVMAIRIQRDVGGNLAELLSSVADTLRERERLRRQVDALSAEGRLSGAILGALPLVFGLYLLLTRPEYIAPLFNTQLGLVLLAIGGVMLIVGGFWMSRVIKVKV